jgi:hypothetical protein
MEAIDVMFAANMGRTPASELKPVQLDAYELAAAKQTTFLALLISMLMIIHTIGLLRMQYYARQAL